MGKLVLGLSCLALLAVGCTTNENGGAAPLVGNSPTPTVTNAGSGESVSTTTTAEESTGGTMPSPELTDRTNCDEMRGTQYRSEAERSFFLANCITPEVPPPTATTPPTTGGGSTSIPTPTAPPSPPSNCHPSYQGGVDTRTGGCIRSGVGDYDCAGGSGNGPNYARGPVRVVGGDPFDLDRDNDGLGCE